MQNINLTDHFLIAMPAMDDPCFSKSLIYIAEHNEQGALGIIVNRPIDMNLAALFDNIDVSFEADDSTNLGNCPVFSAAQYKLTVALFCIVQLVTGNRRWRSIQKSA